MRGFVRNPARVSNPPGREAELALGRQGELLTDKVHGDYYNLARRGQLFMCSTTLAGVGLASSSTSTAGRFFLHNPVGSGVNVEFIEIQMGYVGSTVVDPYVFAWEQAIWLEGLPVSPSASLFIQPLGVGLYAGGSGASIATRVKCHTSCTNFNNTGLLGLPGAVTNAVGVATAAATANVRHAQLGRDMKGIMAAPGTISMMYRITTSSTLFISYIWAEWPIP